MNLEPLGEDRLEALLPLVREYHAFQGIHMPEADRRRAVQGLLADPALGVVWAIRMEDAWIGYIALTFGYSIEMRGRDAFIDELFVRELYRGRGIGTRVLEETRIRAPALGLRALHLEVDRRNRAARALYAKCGFALRDRFSLMTLRL